jgi:hypothetical protein
VANDRKEKRKGMIIQYKKETAFVVHFNDHLPVNSQVLEQDTHTNACQPLRAITQSVKDLQK